MRKAVFTIVNNDPFIHIWYKYYSQFFEDKDIYILNHETTDGSLNGLKCNIIDVKHDIRFDHDWLCDTVKKQQVILLNHYDYVVFAEADELIAHTQKKLNDYIDGLQEPYVTCRGLTLLGGEPYNKHILIRNQRNRIIWDETYNKTLISRIPINWINGFHYRNDYMYQLSKGEEDKSIDEHLLLIHLHYFDLDILLRRGMARIDQIEKNQKGRDLDGPNNKYKSLADYIKDYRKVNEQEGIEYYLPEYV